MLKSMTAFGRASKKTPLGVFTVEIQSINRKHLEINIALPSPFARFESEIRKQVAACVFRGSIAVKIAILTETTSPIAIKPNLSLLKQYNAAWEVISKELNIPYDNTQCFFNLLNSESNLFLIEDTIENDNEFLKDITEVVQSSLQSFLRMKSDEGNMLEKDILCRWQKLKVAIGQITERAPGAVKRYRQKLIERLKEVTTENLTDDERILKEIGIYAEKIDISEEIIRFESHLQQFFEFIHSQSDSLGKTLEFILQELNREINTIGSKASDIDISRLVIEGKSELERIREQIHNVE